MAIVKWSALSLLALLSLGEVAGAAGPAPPKNSARAAAAGLPEAVQMTLAILLRGAQVGPGSGWFHPSQSPYGWKWLAGRMDADRDGVISRKEFKGPAELFDRLDRDGDGRITPADFDWSAKSPWVSQSRAAGMLFSRADANSNGRISAAEWQALFKKAAGGKDHLTPEDLRQMLLPPRPPAGPGKGREAGMPPRLVLLKGLLQGEIGSLYEGPDLGQPAPDFCLETQDGKRKVALSDYRGKKPVVLVFGSFT
jgi:hypothetical protein